MDEKNVNNDFASVNEDDIISGLIQAAESVKNDKALIKIKRYNAGKKADEVLFSFRVRVMTEDEMEEIRERYRTYKHNPRTGQSVVDKFDNNRFVSEVIYIATIPEDRAKIWENPVIKKNYNILNNVDVVDTLLKPGEKDQASNVIMKLAGFTGEEDQGIELLKN